MNLQDFVAKWTGKTVDTDGVYPNQCMDLMHQYCMDVLGLSPKSLSAPAAKDVYLQYPNLADQNRFDQISNSPSAVPQPGDIMFWGTAIGQYGHVAVFVSGDANSFNSFDANWPLGSLPHIQNHNYSGVLGWLRFKGVQAAVQVTPPTMSENDTVVSMLPGLHVGQFRIDGTPTVYSVFGVPDPHWETDILKQDFAKVTVLPSDWPVSPNGWMAQRQALQPNVDGMVAQLATANQELADKNGLVSKQSDALAAASKTVSDLQKQLAAALTDRDAALAKAATLITTQATPVPDVLPSPADQTENPVTQSPVKPGILFYIVKFISSIIKK